MTALDLLSWIEPASITGIALPRYCRSPLVEALPTVGVGNVRMTAGEGPSCGPLQPAGSQGQLHENGAGFAQFRPYP